MCTGLFSYKETPSAARSTASCNVPPKNQYGTVLLRRNRFLEWSLCLAAFSIVNHMCGYWKSNGQAFPCSVHMRFFPGEFPGKPHCGWVPPSGKVLCRQRTNFSSCFGWIASIMKSLSMNHIDCHPYIWYGRSTLCTLSWLLHTFPTATACVDPTQSPLSKRSTTPSCENRKNML